MAILGKTWNPSSPQVLTWLIYYSNLPYKMGKDFLNIQYH